MTCVHLYLNILSLTLQVVRYFSTIDELIEDFNVIMNDRLSDP